LAIWFHDARYNVLHLDNERASAQWAKQFLQQNKLPESMSSAVHDLILETEKHVQVEDKDAAYFLDIDLSIFGASPDVYQAYAQAIRQEYRHFPDVIYVKKRQQILQGFLATDRSIYQTDYFKAVYAQQANINIQWELSLN